MDMTKTVDSESKKLTHGEHIIWKKYLQKFIEEKWAENDEEKASNTSILDWEGVGGGGGKKYESNREMNEDKLDFLTSTIFFVYVLVKSTLMALILFLKLSWKPLFWLLLGYS